MPKKRQHPDRNEPHDDGLIIKAVATVTQVAEMVGLSRERFYQLIRAGTFPAPQQPEGVARPCYTEEGQRACLTVRRTGVGVNGRPVLFNRRPSRPRPAKPATSDGQPAAPQPPAPALSELAEVSLVLDGVRALGLDATAEQVDAALRACFSHGVNGADDGAVVAAVFRHLYQKQRNV